MCRRFVCFTFFEKVFTFCGYLLWASKERMKRMNNGMKIFESKEFGKVRAIMADGVPWFVGKDVAVALGYAHPENAIKTHVDVDDSLNRGVVDSLGRTQQAILINESGLYSLIMSSKLAAAKGFKRWVTSEVLPSIRKHGAYVTDELLANSDKLNQTMEELKAEHTLRIKAERENNELRADNESMRTELALVESKRKARIEKQLATNKAKRDADSMTSAQVLVAMARRISMRMYHNDFRHGTNAFYKTIICNGIDLYGRREEWQKTHTAKSGNAPKLYEFIREDEAAVCINAVANYFNRIDFTDLVVKHNKAA